MGNRKDIPPEFQPAGHVVLAGVVQKQFAAVRLPTRGTDLCRVVLEIEDNDVTVAAYGELAEQLAQAEAGAGVRVEGRLVQHRWQTQRGQAKERLEVEAETIKILARPNSAKARLCQSCTTQS